MIHQSQGASCPGQSAGLRKGTASHSFFNPQLEKTKLRKSLHIRSGRPSCTYRPVVVVASLQVLVLRRFELVGVVARKPQAGQRSSWWARRNRSSIRLEEGGGAGGRCGQHSQLLGEEGEEASLLSAEQGEGVDDLVFPPPATIYFRLRKR